MKLRAAIFVSLFVGFAAVAIGCGDDDSGPQADAAAVVADAAANPADASPPDSSAASACYPTGIYGKCTTTGCPNCLQGASIYSVCTKACTTAADCGDAADFDGATAPFCAPLNPGSTSMICVLTCTDTADCPCGLDCRASGVQGVNICAETL